MSIKKMIKLMLSSTNECPYRGKLEKHTNVVEAINLSELCKEFADDGYLDEAMGEPSEVWVKVINELEKIRLEYGNK